MTEGAPGPSGAPPGVAQVLARSLRRERTRAGLSLTELARRAGVAKSTLSQLESATGNPSIETLWALSTALGVPFSHLVDPPRAAVEVVRFGEGVRFSAGDADYAATLLTTSPPNARRDVYLVSADPGRPRLADPHGQGVVEHVVLSVGRARVGTTDETVELGPGDYVRYPGDVEHVFEALEPGTTAVLVSEHV
ncbi:helix-turn-helix domain-containing protein [Kineococcus terrestris]|uniref:helix-turn-helix domain-containing protein n=1 Tax=Kineococcus terrestris TaxID=2044856 RepID=UPI0034DB07AB